jgi:hypothetical protein
MTILNVRHTMVYRYRHRSGSEIKEAVLGPRGTCPLRPIYLTTQQGGRALPLGT